jgi:hypothetical protein
VRVTIVPAGPFIHEITSLIGLFSVICFSSTFKILSHHLIHAVSAGEPEIGEIIISSPGVGISI